MKATSPDGTASVSENVRLFVKGKPYLQEALERGVVNYSALARVIDGEMGNRNFDAIKAALMRLGRKFAHNRKNAEQKLLKVIRTSRLEMRDKIAVIISSTKLDVPTIASAKSASGYTHIVEEWSVDGVRNRNILKAQTGLSMITIVSGESLEETPGVIAYLLAALAAENINVVEFMSCYKDTLLVLKDADIMKAYQILYERLKV
jgi:aspartokinase